MHLFDKDIQAKTTPLDDNKLLHQIDVSDNFSINGVPNGGYLMAILAHQMLNRSDKGTTPIFTVNYLSRTNIGPAVIISDEISRSRQFNRYEARLIQNNRKILRAMGTFMADNLDCSLDRYEEQPPDIKPLEECIPITNVDHITVYKNMEVYLEPESARWMRGETSSISEQKGWIRFKEDRAFDTCGILLAADAFPPPIFASQGLVAWVPTIEMSVNVRNLPCSHWLKCCFRTKHITCGLLEEDGELWDEEGNLVAISRQIAQFRK